MKNSKLKTALVTGASSGIGKAIAHQLLSDGLTVYVAARRVDKMQDLVQKGATALKMDVTQQADIDAAFDTIAQQTTGIDVLVNNAGYAIYGAVEDTTIEDARRQFEVNLFGLAAVTKKALPYMRQQKAGRIINISSMGGKMYTPLGAWYHGTKHALEGWSDCLRIELAPFGIDVVIVEPGVIKTEFDDVMSGPMIERSGKGPYANMAHKIAQATQKTYSAGQSSPPEVIAKVVSKAIKVKKPKTRYVKGKMAAPMMFLRKWLSDRLFDKALMSQVK